MISLFGINLFRDTKSFTNHLTIAKIHLMKEQTTICEISINYKPARKISQLPCIKVSKDVYSYFKQLWSDKIDYTEEMYLMLLNRANKVLGYVLLSKGGTTGTVVDPKMVFQAALKANAHALILCHNH